MTEEKFDPAHVPESWQASPRPQGALPAHFRNRGDRPLTTMKISGAVVAGLGLVITLGAAFLVDAGTGIFALFLLAGLFIYFVPTLLAVDNHHRNAAAIAALNIILGWTILGWGAALVWALYKERR